MRIRNATDLHLDLDRFPAPVGHDAGWIFVEGPPGWSMMDHAKAHFGVGTCPCCSGLPMRRSGYCLGCDRTGLDGRFSFSGLPIGAYQDPDWKAEPTAYAPDPELAGGVEARPVKVRKGLRRRKAG